MSSNTPEYGKPREFMKPTGFTKAGDLRMTPARISDYASQGMTVPKPGEYSQNNGVIAAATSSGEIVVWVTKEDPNALREVSYDQAVKNLEQNGYTKSSFGVPTF